MRFRRKRRESHVFPSRTELVESFHELRELDQPPVLVVKGMYGMGKTELLTRMQTTYQELRGWAWAEEADARVNLGAGVAPDPLGMFTRLSIELRAGSSIFRPASTPRFRRIREEFLKEFMHEGSDDMSPGLRAGLAVGDLAATYAAHAAGQSSPPIRPSQLAPALRPARWVWRRVGRTKTQGWCREFISSLPRSDVPASVAAVRLEAYLQGLGNAFAEDLKAASQRQILKLGKVVVFVDAYDRIENDTPRTHFLVDFAVRIQLIAAPVMLVVACRDERLWTRLLEETGASESYGDFAVAPQVEIYDLQPIPEFSARHYLRLRGVPGDLATRLAPLSGGVPMALALQAEAFGQRKTGHLFEWQRRLLEELPPIPREGPDDVWARRFATVIGRALIHESRPETRTHVQAAACCRNFNRDLLAAILDDDFDGIAYEALVTGPWVEKHRNSLVLADPAANKLRSFARELLTHDPAHAERDARWHRRAQECLIGLHAQAEDHHRAYLIDVEVLFHLFGSDSDQAKEAFSRAFTQALHQQRIDRCQLLIEAANDAGAASQDWGLQVAIVAGTLFLQHGEYGLAEMRFGRALPRTRIGTPDQVEVLTRLVTCCRLKGDHLQAQAYLRRLQGLASGDPTVELERAWQQSLVAKARGDLWLAHDANDQAFALLSTLEHSVLASSDAVARRVLENPGLRAAHIQRNRADIALRMGDYRTAAAAISEARGRYRAFPEVAAEAHLNLLEANLARQEGDPEAAVAAARSAIERFAPSSTTTDRRGAMMATRALAQACLAVAPESSVEHFTSLVDAEAGAYPVGKLIGYWGLGEAARHSDDHPQARLHYEEALASVPAGDAVEALFVRLSLVELIRIEGRGGFEQIRAIASLDRVEAHPALAVAAALIELRCAHDDTARSRATNRAQHHLSRFVLQGETSAHHRLVERHLATPLAGANWPTLQFVFP